MMTFALRNWALGMIFVAAAAVSCTQDFNVFHFADENGAGASTPAGSTGAAGECSGPATCPQGAACKKASCIDGACGFQLQTAGAVCAEDGGIVCDGLGTCVACNKNSDCSDGAKPLCDKKKCIPLQCKNASKDGKETDVDCGGTDTGCAKCVDGEDCLGASDCLSNLCQVAGAGAGGGGGMAAGPGVCASCGVDADCGAAAFCKDKTTCVSLGKLGDLCMTNNACGSGFCADGRCCNTACDGTCVACSKEKSGGKDGECTVFKQGADKEFDCVDSKPVTCGPATDKGCSGAPLDASGTTSSCEVWDATTACITASCDTVKNEQTAAASCDGKGACPMPQKTGCGQYVCDSMNAACLKNCTGPKEANCKLDSYCDGTACQLCGLNLAAPGQAIAPAGCSNATKTCTKTCTNSSCSNYVCPAGYACFVNCTGQDACKDITITCPDSYACTVVCDAQSACENATIKAGAGGILSTTCGAATDTCKDTKIACGVNACEAKCGGASKPMISGCGKLATDSCNCTTATCQ